MFNYIIIIKDTTRNLILQEKLETLSERSVEELEEIFHLNKVFTSDDFIEYYEICEIDDKSGEIITLKHFDTGFKMDM